MNANTKKSEEIAELRKYNSVLSDLLNGNHGLSYDERGDFLKVMRDNLSRIDYLVSLA